MDGSKEQNDFGLQFEEATRPSRKRLSSIGLRAFRSYAGGEDSHVAFGDLTFLVGRNASGKSNLLDALAFISEISREPIHSALERRGGIEALRTQRPGQGRPWDVVLSVFIQLEGGRVGYFYLDLASARMKGFRVSEEFFGVKQTDATDWESYYSRKADHVESTDPLLATRLPGEDALLLPLITGHFPFGELATALGGICVYSIDPESMREPQIPDEGKVLARNGANSASIVRRMRRTAGWRLVMEFLRAAVPQISDVDTVRVGVKTSLIFRQQHSDGKLLSFEGHQVSDGTLRLIGLLLALFQEPRPMLIALEEPERGLHPGALAVVLDAIREASEDCQVVVTTQSSDLLDDKDIDPGEIRIVEWTEGGTLVSRLSEGTAEVLRRHLRTAGELIRSRALEVSTVA